MRRKGIGLKSFFLQLAGLGWVSFLFCWLLAQEEPTGSLRIRVIAKDTQQPLARIRVWRQRVGRESDSFYMTSNAQGWIWRRKLPVGQYEITSAYGGGYQLEEAGPRFEILEGQETSLTLELTPLPPYVYFSVPYRQFTPQQKVQVDCYGYSREKQLHLYLYKVLPLQYLLNAPSEGETPFGQKPEEIGLKTALKGARRIKNWTLPIKPSSNPENPLSFQFPISLPNLPRGLYVLIGNLGNLQAFTPLLISNLGLICKQAPDHLLLYTQRISDNQPQPQVRLYLFNNKKESIRGTTDAQGLWEWRGSLGQTPLVFAQQGEDIAWLQSGVYSVGEQEKYRLYLFTERPLYRPGQRVFFKGIVCSLTDNQYRVVPGQKVTVEIRDAQDSLVWKKKFTTNSRGSFWGFFPLGIEVALGNWRLIGNVLGKIQETSFGVAEYRKPEYQVEVTTDKKEYIRGEMIRVKGNARYYWGGPVVKAKVNYTVTGSDYWFYPNEGGTLEAFFPYEESRIYGQEIANGQVITDEKGSFSFLVPTQKEGIVFSEFQDQLFQIEAEVIDSAERSVSRSVHCLVVRGEITLFLKTENYVYGLDDQVYLSLLVTDLKGKKQKGVPIDLRVTPPSVGKRATKEGQRPYVKAQPEERQTFRITSDAEGRGAFRFRVDRQGEWTLTATALDRRGNRVSTRLQLWVVEGSFRDPSYFYPELALQWNKKVFHPGEVAKVLINTSARNLYALVSLEGPKIFWWKQVFLKGGSSLFQFPVKEEYLPNAYLSVCFAEGRKFVQQSIPLKITLDHHLLKVKVTSDKPEYRPREKANFTITCRDNQGKPVQAEISLGIVDEAIYGILEEQRPDIAQVIYGERENRVQTLYSFPEIYYSGGAKEGSIGEVRRWFPDTWKWIPNLITDKKGQVYLQLTVPDTLTTWRLTVKAHTPSVAVGSAVHKIKVRKDLMARLITPPFFTQGDYTVLTLFLHNETSKSQKVKTLLKVGGLRLLSPSYARVTLAPGQEGKVDYSVKAEVAGTARLLASVLAESGLQDAVQLSLPVLPHGIEKRIVFSGESEKTLSRNFLLPDGIIPEATKGSVTLSGSTAGVILQALDYLHSTYYGTSENVVGWFLPDMTVAMVFRELGITLKEIEQKLPERVTSNLQRLYHLQREDGGWGWSDNTQSDAFWTAYVLYGLTQAQKAGYSVEEIHLQRGLQWLKDHLESLHNESDKALVLYVMAFAASGSLSQEKRGENQLYSSLLKRECMALAHQLKPLTEKNYGLSLLILALNQLGLKKPSRELAKVLEQRAKATSEECWWEETYPWGFYSCNPYETTGYALKALASVDPYNPKIAKSARWLMRQRQVNGGWWSTEDTASVIYALADYLKISQERESPNYLARVFINHSLVKEIPINSTNRFNRFEVLIPRHLLKRGVNLLHLEKQGVGKLFYNGVIRYWSTGENLPPESQGLKVTRQYFLRTRSLQEGGRWRENLQPVRGFVRIGDEIVVRLTIEPQADCKQVIINDPIPSGGEVIEASSSEEEQGWFARREVHNNRVTFYVDYLSKGKHYLSYVLRAERKGEFHILPTQAKCLYIPEIWGTGEETQMRVR